MSILSALLDKSHQISIITKEDFDIDLIEKYYVAYSLWMRTSPIPSRPIFERAWMEANILAETSVFLSLHGFYEQACATLRMEIDGFLTRMYWDILDTKNEIKHFYQGDKFTNNYWEWEKGGEEKIYQNNIKSALVTNDFFNAFNNKYNLWNDITDHNQLLHKYIHGRPPNRHTPGNIRSSSINIKFVKKEFDEWFELFGKTYDFMSIVSILLYPQYLKTLSTKEFIFLKSKTINQITNIIGD